MSDLTICPCQNGTALNDCCGRYLSGAAAPTAEALMRSRYTAYALRDEAYLRRTWHPATCPPNLDLDPATRWIGLKVIDTVAGGVDDDSGEVAFVARYKIAGKGHRLEERSHFARLGGRWIYVGAVVG